jgi:hypothetical protein
VSLGTLGQRLSGIATDFDPRTYGYRKLSDLVRKTGAFDVDQPATGGLRVRLMLEQPGTSAKAPARPSGKAPARQAS